MPPYIVAVNHPSLLSFVDSFVDELRRESRGFGRVDAANPKPSLSLVRKVTDPARTRFGVMTEHGLVGMASLSEDGEISMAVAAPHRSAGHGKTLLVHVIQVAEQGRACMSPSHRIRPIARLDDRPGWITLDVPRRRTA